MKSKGTLVVDNPREPGDFPGPLNTMMRGRKWVCVSKM